MLEVAAIQASDRSNTLSPRSEGPFQYRRSLPTTLSSRNGEPGAGNLVFEADAARFPHGSIHQQLRDGSFLDGSQRPRVPAACLLPVLFRMTFGTGGRTHKIRRRQEKALESAARQQPPSHPKWGPLHQWTRWLYHLLIGAARKRLTETFPIGRIGSTDPRG